MELHTKRLILSPVKAESLPSLAELLTDTQVAKTYMVPDFLSPAAAEAMAKRIQIFSQEERPIVFGIYLGDQLIGILNETERTESAIEVGYALLPRFHNQGYATEALSGAIQYLWAQGFQQVTAGAFEENAASIRVMQKCGMVLSPHQDMVDYRGETHRCVYYCAHKPVN